LANLAKSGNSLNQPATTPPIESSPIVKQPPKIWEPLQDNEVIKDAKCTIENEFLVFCGPEGKREAMNLKFSDIENQIAQCYMGETVVCNIKKDTELRIYF
jgi:hypothetical protein